MRRIRVIVALLIAVSACGDSGDATTTTVARNCDELAVAGVDLIDDTFRLVDLQEAADLDQQRVPDVSGILEAFREDNAKLLARQTTLDCNHEDIDSYFCANVDDISAIGEISRELLTELIQATC